MRLGKEGSTLAKVGATGRGARWFILTPQRSRRAPEASQLIPLASRRAALELIAWCRLGEPESPGPGTQTDPEAKASESSAADENALWLAKGFQ